jgi:Asp-tRNA(Asn)/Glu-tRNA(Gln) amidotransferase A subunit family amidase
LSCEDLVASCLERIRTRDPIVRAWAHLDPDRVIARAREADDAETRGPLHGLPFGVKDIFSTFDMPTRCNSLLYGDRPNGPDAAAVAVLRASGGIVLGKTATVEFAFGGRRPATRNPHDPTHTPGGSSAGSAAAVADFMTPVALGTQTAGSILRPAAFNGIYGFKPTHGLVGLDGVKVVAPTLDTVGWFARDVDDLRLLAEVFRIPKAAAPDRPDGIAGLRIGLCRTPHWDIAEPCVRDALIRAGERLEAAGAIVEPFELDGAFAELTTFKDVVMYGEGRVAFLADLLDHGEGLADEIRACATDARAITPAALGAALDTTARLRIVFDRICARRFDAVLTPSAPGEAPSGLRATGDPIFNGLWTALHVPCVALPVGVGPRGLPIGLQLVGPRYSDHRLLDVAEAVAAVLAPEGLRPPSSFAAFEAASPDLAAVAVAGAARLVECGDAAS